MPVVKGVTKDGVAYTKDFDVKFLTAQRIMLLEETRRAARSGDAARGRGQLVDRGTGDG